MYVIKIFILFNVLTDNRKVTKRVKITAPSKNNTAFEINDKQ